MRKLGDMLTIKMSTIDKSDKHKTVWDTAALSNDQSCLSDFRY